MTRRTTSEKRAARRANMEAQALAVATELEAWTAAYGDRPLTPEFARWDDRGYMRWTAPTNAMGGRPSAPRNF